MVLLNENVSSQSKEILQINKTLEFIKRHYNLLFNLRV